MSEKISRRDFLRKSAVGLAGLTVVPSAVLGKAAGHTAPSDKLNIAAVGIGGMGAANLQNMETENIVALCDVDWKYAKNTFDRYPNAKRYWDYRKMLDEMGKDIDAVLVATADHTHCLIAADAITMGKHVYVQKPLTHTVYESRLLTKLAEKYGVATQMGNQGASGEGVRQVCDWIWNGEIGEVKRVDTFTDRPIWPQGLMRPEQVDEIPETLNWDLFVGPAPMRPYNKLYTPWNWRGWWDFGTGALGDMACHILHPVFKGLQLGYPSKVQGSSTALLTDCAPNAQMVKYVFPARPKKGKVAMPEVEVYWYDGGITPVRPAGMPEGRSLNDQGGGAIFYGTKDTLICGCYGVNPWLVSGRKPSAPKMNREITVSHEQDWIRACKEDAKNRVKTASDFSEAGPFNEMVVMGVLAVRLQGLNRELLWDGDNMRFKNIGSGDQIAIMIEDGFTIHNGHPTFNKRYTDPINAQQFAAEMRRLGTARDAQVISENQLINNQTMKRIMYALGCLALAATVASCGSNANKKAAADSTATAQAQAPAEDEGWTVIFDGKTLDGWRGYDKTGVPAAWTVEDGAIKINGSGMGEAGAQDGGDLIYANKKFKNFELEFEYKVDKGANSGVFYLAQEIPGQPIFISAPEYQVLDNANHPDAKLGVDGNRQSASLYDMIPAKPQNAKPFGEWNTAKIMVYNGTVVHYQNGEQVLEYHLWTPQWKEMLDKSKFSKEKWPEAYDLLINCGGENHEGYIGLQDHGDNVWFRNIRVKEL